YYAQQAAEKALKGYLVAKDLPIKKIFAYSMCRL
ncbi:HEPN domain-containing protein, partial [Candidatus Dependentiae bacterium]|nr:HEPN domain-containing protein [Candidatus Dependentiae bacterium]